MEVEEMGQAERKCQDDSGNSGTFSGPSTLVKAGSGI